MERLKELRKKAGLSQDDVSKHLGVSQPAYGNYENGNREPDFNILRAIANYFEVSIDYLLGEKQNSNKFEKSLSRDEIDLLSMYRAFDTKTRADMFDLINFTYKKQQGIEKSLFSTYGKGKDEQVINTKKINVR